MYAPSVDREVDTAQSDFSGLSDIESVGSNLQALKDELDKTREELEKIDDGSIARGATWAHPTAHPPENSSIHDCTNGVEVIKAGDGGVEEDFDDWSSSSGLLGDGAEYNTGKFWQCTKNTVNIMMKMVGEVKAVRSECESLRHELALSEAEVGLLQQKLQKCGSSKSGNTNGSSNVLKPESNILKRSVEVDKQRRSATLEPIIVHGDGHTNSEDEQTTGRGRRYAYQMKINNFIRKLNGNERHTTHLAAFEDHSHVKAIFHRPGGLKEERMPSKYIDTQQIAKEAKDMAQQEFIGFSQQIKELQDTVNRQVKEIEELHVLREKEAQESMKLQDMLQGKVLKLQETAQEQASQQDTARDLREIVKELKAMTMTTGEKKQQNPLAATSCRSSPPTVPSHCWRESRTSYDLEHSGINGEYSSTNRKAELANLKFRLESRLEQISITLKLESMYARVKVMEKDIIVEKRKNVICQRARWNNPNDHEDEMRIEIMKERALCEKALREREEAEKQLQRVLVVARRALVKSLGGKGRERKAEELSERVVDRLLRRTVK